MSQGWIILGILIVIAIFWIWERKGDRDYETFNPMEVFEQAVKNYMPDAKVVEIETQIGDGALPYDHIRHFKGIIDCHGTKITITSDLDRIAIDHAVFDLASRRQYPGLMTWIP